MPSAIYLSPHLDDAVFSCGGLIARQIEEGGSVTVVTIFAGDPPQGELSEFALELHQRWGHPSRAMAVRRAEDLEACALLGAAALHLSVPDAIYRRSEEGHLFYPNEAAIFGEVHAQDSTLIDGLRQALEEIATVTSHVYVPLAIGGHVDHRLVRSAAQDLDRRLWYYPDFPYAARGDQAPDSWGQPRGVESVIPLEPEEVEAWVEAAGAYVSQKSTFWEDDLALRAEIQEYLGTNHGLKVLAPRRRGMPGG